MTQSIGEAPRAVVDAIGQRHARKRPEVRIACQAAAEDNGEGATGDEITVYAELYEVRNRDVRKTVPPPSAWTDVAKARDARRACEHVDEFARSRHQPGPRDGFDERVRPGLQSGRCSVGRKFHRLPTFGAVDASIDGTRRVRICKGDVIMIKFKVIGISIVASTLFAAASCMAQALGQPERTYAPAVPAPRATQVMRCQDFGRYVNLVASARDAGESRKHLIDRLGLNLRRGNEMYQGRLPRHTRAAGGTALVRQIYAKNATPADWQKAMLADCEKKIVN